MVSVTVIHFDCGLSTMMMITMILHDFIEYCDYDYDDGDDDDDEKLRHIIVVMMMKN